MEKVDILLATYNGEKYLKEQIDSILKQTYSDFRLIISDDASKDGTREILEEYEKLDKRIEVYYHKKNVGSTKNFEFLLSKVKAPYYMLSDQDDIWFMNKVEKSLKKIEESGCDLVFGDLEVVDDKLNTVNDSFAKMKNLYNKIMNDHNYEALFLNNYVTGCTIISKKECLDKILPFPKNTKYLIHDYWIALVISQTGRIAYMDEPLLKYRQHSGNQVGVKTESEKKQSINEIRNLFIDVKIEHFRVFVENSILFSEERKRISKEALAYFRKLKNGEKPTSAEKKLFKQLYKYEDKKYYYLNYIILNMPGLAKFLFKFKKFYKS